MRTSTEVEAVTRDIIRRGTVQLNLRVERPASSEDYRINSPVIENYRKQLEAYTGRSEWNDPDNAVVRMWEVASGKLVREFRGHSGPIMALEFSPDDRHMLSVASDRHDASGSLYRQFLSHWTRAEAS